MNVTVVASPHGVSLSEGDVVLFNRLRTAQKDTLLSLTQFVTLMEKLPTIPVADEVGARLQNALFFLRKVPFSNSICFLFALIMSLVAQGNGFIVIRRGVEFSGPRFSGRREGLL